MKLERGYYDIFLRTCAKNPAGTAAIIFEDGIYKRFSYSELYGVCEYLSQTLQHLGCNKGLIGLVTDRNIIIPAVIAAAHKCCSTFMFINPKQNVEKIHTDAKFNTIISIEANEGTFKLFNKDPDKCINIFGLAINVFNLGSMSCVHSSNYEDDHFFIAQTSGSTGEPKHIKVPLQCLQPNIDDFTKMFKVSSKDIIYFSTPLTFDPSMIEILLACANGAALLIAPEIPQVLFPHNRENAITIWQTTPSKFFQQSYLDIKNIILSKTSTLRILALGGEPLNNVKRLKELKDKDNKTRIFALYGVTEMSCWACAAELDLQKPITDWEVPLGACLSETQLIIEPLTEDKTQGKILLASDSRRCILLNKTKEGKNTILKKVDTGDIAEIRNKTTFFMGRMDDVIKRFGHKINLNMIESVVMQCPKVKSCSCVWLHKPMLVVVYFSSEDFSSQELSDFLKCKLDDKHWPDKIIHVENIPTNSHGKISRQNTANMYKPTKDIPSIESLQLLFLAEVKSILNASYGYEDIKHKTFFSIGGTSFNAVALCNKLSLSAPPFGKLVLQYILSQNNSIDNVLNLAHKELSSTNKVKVKIKRLRTEIDTNSEMMTKKVALNACAEMEFIKMWSHDTGKCVDATPTVYKSDHYLYAIVGSHSGKVIIVDTMSGQLIGTVLMKSRIEASVHCFNEHPRLPPCGVVGSYDGTIVCFTIETCEEIWRQKTPYMIKSKAITCNGLIYIASYDGSVRCLDVMNGNIQHVINVANQAISADLVLAKKEFVLTGTLSGVCASINTESKVVAWRGSLSSPVFGAPVLYDNNKYVIFAEVSGVIHCRTVEKGITIWKFQGVKGNVFSSLNISELDRHRWQLIFGCHDNNVYSLIVKNFQPSLQWKSKLSSPVYSTPFQFSDNLVIAVSNNGTIYGLDKENGSIHTQDKLPDEVFSSPVTYRDYVFIGCRNDHLIAFKFVSNV